MTDPRFEETVYTIDATHDEVHFLWCQYAAESPLPSYFPRSPIEPESLGRFEQVGELAGRPVCVSLLWWKVRGARICFIDAVSEVVDWKLIDAWRRERFPGVPHTNAGNFHNCIGSL